MSLPRSTRPPMAPLPTSFNQPKNHRHDISKLLTNKERLATFSLVAWPTTCKWTPEDCARAGLVYANQGDLVRCPICEHTVSARKQQNLSHYSIHKCGCPSLLLQSGMSTTPYFIKAYNEFQDSEQERKQAELVAKQAAMEAAQRQQAEKQAAKQAIKQAELVAEQAAKEAAKPTPSVSADLAVFDPTLQYDFVGSRLFHDVERFVAYIQQHCDVDRFREPDVLKILPKCLRGPAYSWYQSQDDLKDMNLQAILQALVVMFQIAPAPSSRLDTPPHQPLRQQPPPVDYHTCTRCSAQFSSISRLLRHTQGDACGKVVCKQCEQLFTSNNQLHEHLRGDCSASVSATKGKIAAKPAPQAENSAVTPPVTPLAVPTAPATLVRQQSIPLASPTIAIPLPIYRSISPSPPVYKNFMTIDDLFMRYAPLKSIYRSGSATANESSRSKQRSFFPTNHSPLRPWIKPKVLYYHVSSCGPFGRNRPLFPACTTKTTTVV